MVRRIAKPRILKTPRPKITRKNIGSNTQTARKKDLKPTRGPNSPMYLKADSSGRVRQQKVTIAKRRPPSKAVPKDNFKRPLKKLPGGRGILRKKR